MQTRYNVEWTPRDAVARVYHQHQSAIDHEGASVWDYVDVDQLSKVKHVGTETAALDLCRGVVGQDEFGEVRVTHAVFVDDGYGGYWETMAVSHYYDGDDQLDWQPY